jgi:S-DNA-T family DNA segregation ATPase FtsK/SpoIIIE
VPVGLVDEPRHQTQGLFRLDLSRNVVVYGGAGSGKSTLLRTLATSLALTHSPDDVQVFAVDFGARALRPLRRLPHCGPDGVFFATETDRIRRLFRYLSSQLAQRREAGIVNLRQQRAAGAAGVPPFVVVLLDNYAGFRETFEAEEMTRSHEHLIDDLATLMRDGPAAGIVFALTATQIGGIASGIENAAEVRLVLRQKDPADYALIGRFEKPPVRVPPGRGFAAGAVPLEFQVALPPPDDASDTTTSGGEWGDLMTDMNRHWQRGAADGANHRRPSPVQDLPRWIALDDARLQPTVPRGAAKANGDGMGALPRQMFLARQPVLPITLGLDDETLGPLRVDLAEAHHLIVAGPPSSGKTTLLLTALLSSLATPVGRRAQWYLVTPRDSALAELAGYPNCAGRVGDVTALTELLTELEDELATRRERQREADTGAPGRPHDRGADQVERRHDDAGNRVLIVVDDYDVLRQDDEDESGLVETQLINLAKRGRLAGLHILAAGYNVELRRYNQQLAQHIAQTGAGALLQPDLDADGELFGGIRLRRFSQGEPPPGRGYFVYRQQLRLFQAATPLEAGPLGEGPREVGADLRVALRRRLAASSAGTVSPNGPGPAP